ncbi:L-threonylcarbamoyladenylate synthase [Mycoplasma sp. 4079]|uniref:L-threonylcarbamoyladenylate synthase n=1 Tax=Mycoplasma sp. 4079 TaxID=3398615 RepID=UPI0039FD359F
MERSKYKDIFLVSTDTVPGLGSFVSPETLEALYELKQRPLDKKMVIVVGSLEQAQGFAQWNEEANAFAIHKWPGANTIIVNDQGFRMPACKAFQEFLIKNGPMYLTSANLSGQPASKTLEEAKAQFPMIQNVIDFCEGTGTPSTIYNLDTRETIRR